MKYWKRVQDGTTTTVESYSHDEDIPGAIEITEQEFNNYIASLPPPVIELTPDEIRAAEILATSPDVITMPEIWELLRIFGRRLGFPN